jgi:2-keto-4-pentenoate hydratase
MEIVDSRIADWDIAITDTIADNASSGCFVLASTTADIDSIDLESALMELTLDGELVSSGVGRACLGSPLNAVVWLANELSRRGTPIAAGDVVLSGALGPMVGVSAPGTYRASIAGLGEARIEFR